ncbi:type II toxin-antitoxin system VapC family toxin [Pleurocapsales cyanobacterium LEGE 06147]|nr:type II toxin-antitoxin system VapC family toxin [Pleurocapsales cyanobacterium LEGE 06147]
MSYLLDTNILLRLLVPEHPMNSDAVKVIDSLRSTGKKLIIASQNLIELWNVCTRPLEKNGLGLTSSETKQEIEQLKTLFVFLPDTAEIYQECERLVTTYNVKGVNVHDTRLIAFMLIHSIDHLLTFNTKDFQRFSNEIFIVHPQKTFSPS